MENSANQQAVKNVVLVHGEVAFGFQKLTGRRSNSLIESNLFAVIVESATAASPSDRFRHIQGLISGITDAIIGWIHRSNTTHIEHFKYFSVTI